MTTYTTESYATTSGTSTTSTTEYRLSDGTRYVRMVTETPKPYGFGYTTKTKVLRADFEGDRERRSTLRELEAAIANAEPVLYVNDAPALSISEKRDAAIARAKAEDAARAEEEAANGYRTYEPYRNAEPAARETVDAVFSALDSAGYVGNVGRGVALDYPSGSVTASFGLPNIDGEPTRYLVGITHDGYLIRLAKYVHTGRTVWDEEADEEVPESVWRTVRVHAGERAGDILAPALRDRPALRRWQNAAGY